MSWEGFRWRNVGDRFELGGFSLDRCRRQFRVGRVFVGEMWAVNRVGKVVVGEMWTTGSGSDGFRWEMWATDSGQDGCCWRDVGDRIEFRRFSTGDVGDRFGSGWLLLERCGRQDRVPTVFDGRCG